MQVGFDSPALVPHLPSAPVHPPNRNAPPFSVTARLRLEVRMLVRALKLQLTGGETLLGALNALVTQKWAASVVNGQTIHFLKGMETLLKEGDEVLFLPMISGG